MSIFSKKKEVNLEDFCRTFYDIQIQVVKGVNSSDVYPDYIRESLIKADDVFANVDTKKFEDELIILHFELFALAFLHQFGKELAIIQSIYTNRYLHDIKKEDIWNGMEHYNKAVAHSITVEKGNKRGVALINKERADLADEYITKAKSMGVDFNDEYQAGSLGLPINRFFSKRAWRKDITVYFLILALCHRLDLGYGPDYTGPNKKAQNFLASAIKDLYKVARQSLSKVKIIVG